METPGKCRWCGCTYEEPCPGSCGWANAKQTLCTACVNVDREWSHLKRVQPIPNMRRSFFRGYMAGSDDERATEKGNPYAVSGRTYVYWEHGWFHGRREAR